jgi:hypothetical protein
MIVLLLGTGVVLTVLTGAVQFRYLGFALKEVLGKITQKSVEPGVGVALSGGGHRAGVDGRRRQHRGRGHGHLHRRPRRAALALGVGAARDVHQVRRDRGRAALPREGRDGVMRGGAMYTLKNGLGLPWLGSVFALLVSLAAFGIGNMVQANSVADSLRRLVRHRHHRDRHRPGGAHRGGHPRRHSPHRRGHRDHGAVHGGVLPRRRADHPDPLRRPRFPRPSRWCSAAPSRVRAASGGFAGATRR